MGGSPRGDRRNGSSASRRCPATTAVNYARVTPRVALRSVGARPLSHLRQRPGGGFNICALLAPCSGMPSAARSPHSRGTSDAPEHFKEMQLEAAPARAIFASMAGHVVIRITERLGGGEPLRTAYAVAEPNQHRAIALFKLRPGHTADERVEAVAELTQSALDSLGLKPGMIKPL